MPIVAGIDIGSNAIRMLIAAADREHFHTVESVREPLRIGADTFVSGKISKATSQRLIETLLYFGQIAKHYHATEIRAVATSAIRDAVNGKAVLARVYNATGIEIESISGEEEARLVTLAVKYAINVKSSTALLIDIGGGSVEVTILRHGSIIATDSLPLGTVRLLETLKHRERGDDLFERLVKRYTASLGRRIKTDLTKLRLSICVGTGGNFDEIIDLRERILKRKRSKQVTLKELRSSRRKLLAITYEERIVRYNLRPDRADVIIPACLLMEQILSVSGMNEFEVPKVGLKEGVVLDLVERRSSKNQKELHNQTLAYAIEVGRRYEFAEQHAQKVLYTAQALFDIMLSQHGVGKEYLVLLEVAALLHDIGQYIHPTEHHKHTAYIIRNTPLIGMDEHQRLMTACIARYHRKGLPKSKHDYFEDLSESQRRIVVRLAALLRLADGLAGFDYNRRQMKFSRRWRRLTLHPKRRGDHLVQSWMVAKKSDLMRMVLKVKVELKAGK